MTTEPTDDEIATWKKYIHHQDRIHTTQWLSEQLEMAEKFIDHFQSRKAVTVEALADFMTTSGWWDGMIVKTPEEFAKAIIAKFPFALSEQQGAPEGLTTEFIVQAIRDGYDKAPDHYSTLDTWDDGAEEIARKILRFSKAAPRAEQGAQTLTEGERKFVLSVAALLRSEDFEEWPDKLLSLFDRLAPQGSAPTSDAQENGNG